MRTHAIPYARLAKRFPPFFVAWTGGDPRAAGLLPAASCDFAALRACAETRRTQPLPRPAVSEALAARHRALGSPAAVLDRIEALRAPDTVCAIAGQQPMIAGGPLFVALKALSVLAAARAIESRLGLRCVPLFWNHSDDHDMAEIDGLGWLDAEDRLQTLRAGLPADRRPIRDVADADRLGRFRLDLTDRLPTTRFRAALAVQLEETFDPRPAGWFTRLLTRWFGGEGLVVFEPRWVAREAAPILARALESPGLVGDALAAGGRALADAGFAVPLSGDGPGLFFHRGGVRTRLEPAAGVAGYVLNGCPDPADPPARWIERLQADPESFSAGVALRPVVQDALFPSVAMIAGPNEAAYLAQLGPLYERFRAIRPLVLPRASATIVAPEIAAAARACRAAYEPILRGEAIVPPLPDPLAGPLDAARREIEAALARLGQATAASEGTARNHEKTRARILESIDLYARKLAESACGSGPSRPVDQLRAHLTPGGMLQERKIAALYWLARFGPEFFRRLGEAIDASAPGHQVIDVEA